MLKLKCAEEAYGELVASLEDCRYHVIRVEPFHWVPEREKYCHCLINTSHPEFGLEWHYGKFCGEWYYTFGRAFPDCRAGFGESLNEEVYRYLAFFQKPKFLFFTHPDAVFQVEFDVFSRYCHRKGTIRLQNNRKEVTLSIDARYLHRIREKHEVLKHEL